MCYSCFVTICYLSRGTTHPFPRSKADRVCLSKSEVEGYWLPPTHRSCRRLRRARDLTDRSTAVAASILRLPRVTTDLKRSVLKEVIPTLRKQILLVVIPPYDGGLLPSPHRSCRRHRRARDLTVRSQFDFLSIHNPCVQALWCYTVFNSRDDAGRVSRYRPSVKQGECEPARLEPPKTPCQLESEQHMPTKTNGSPVTGILRCSARSNLGGTA